MPTLVVTEKPNVAERIAKSLGKPKTESEKGVRYFHVGDTYVAAAVGHIFGLRERKKNGWTYPVFDVEWAPSYEISKASAFTKKYLDVIQKLSRKCDKFINACDFDVEGEVIGYNVIKYGCDQDPDSDNVKRIRYSTLTSSSIQKAFENVTPLEFGLAYAGLTRHTLDWYWGINLSRALTNSARKGGYYTTLSMGRVQGPTLKMLSKREKAIKAFNPEKYWQIELVCEKGGVFTALHEEEKIFDEDKAKSILSKLVDTAKVVGVASNKYSQKPPFPFDLTTLQTEAYKHLKIDPRRTLEIAQNLYTNAYISYPRTSSQQIPDDIDCAKIIRDVGFQKPYSALCERLLKKKKLKPSNGKKKDPAHPAIHPTGESPKALDKQSQDVYDLVVRRFLSSFSDPAVRQSMTVSLDDNGEKFISKGNTTLERGWHEFYGRFAKFEETLLPNLNEGDIVQVREKNMSEKETQPPKRYTPASIIREMEKRNLGTKATRSQIVDILFRRGYITGKSLEVSALGLDVVEAMDKYCKDVVSEKLTRQIEKQMDDIMESKTTSEAVLESGRQILTKILKDYKSNESKISSSLVKSIIKSKREQDSVGECPSCKEPLMIRKARYGGNFIGCTGYPECTLTWSLPAGSATKSTKCRQCGYSKVTVKPPKGRKYSICCNPECPTRKVEENGLDNIGKCLKCGSELTVRKSRYGTDFIGCSGYPKCKNIWGLPSEEYKKHDICDHCGYPRIKVKQSKSKSYITCVNPGCKNHSDGIEKGDDVEFGDCPKCGSELRLKKSRYGSLFIGCSGYPKCKNIWGLPNREFKFKGVCSKCKKPIISYKLKTKGLVEGCVNPDCASYYKN